MSDYTVEEIEEAVNDSDGYSELTSSWNDPITLNLELRGEEVTAFQVGGKLPCEGGGEDVDVVFRVGDQLFKKWGAYYSHNGTDWDGDLREVHAVERLVTFYE